MAFNEVQKLFGVWETDPSDSAALSEFGSVRMEFKEDGQLIYSIKKDGKEQIMLMTYGVEGNKLITDQPSRPQREETRFQIKGDRLALDYGGRKSYYIKR